MTEQQSRPVLFADGPLVGQWRDVPSDQHGGEFSEEIGLYGYTGQALPRRAHYRFYTVRVGIGPTQHTVTVASSETMEDLDALFIRRLFTREAANALLGLDVLS